jgi:hypothetical protein
MQIPSYPECEMPLLYTRDAPNNCRAARVFRLFIVTDPAVKQRPPPCLTARLFMHKHIAIFLNEVLASNKALASTSLIKIS